MAHWLGMVEVPTDSWSRPVSKGLACDFERQHVNPMLTLRNAVCNQRWEACWQEIGQEQACLRL
jgi:hypothetical protein